jgi:putative sterol carrier protein
MCASTNIKPLVPFPSHTWAKKYMEWLNASKLYEDSAKTWEGTFLYHIKPDGGATPIELGILLDLWHGKMRGYEFWVQGQPPLKSQFIYSGPEKNWLSLVDGKIDPIQGLMAGKFKLTGDMKIVMRHTTAAKLLVTATQGFALDIVRPDTSDPNAAKWIFSDSKKNKILTYYPKTATFEMHM